MAAQSTVLLDLGQGLSMMVGLPKIASWQEKDRPKNPTRGTFGFNTNSNSLEYFDGENWYLAQMTAP